MCSVSSILAWGNRLPWSNASSDVHNPWQVPRPQMMMIDDLIHWWRDRIACRSVSVLLGWLTFHGNEEYQRLIDDAVLWFGLINHSVDSTRSLCYPVMVMNVAYGRFCWSQKKIPKTRFSGHIKSRLSRPGSTPMTILGGPYIWGWTQ